MGIVVGPLETLATSIGKLVKSLSTVELVLGRWMASHINDNNVSLGFFYLLPNSLLFCFCFVFTSKQLNSLFIPYLLACIYISSHTHTHTHVWYHDRSLVPGLYKCWWVRMDGQMAREKSHQFILYPDPGFVSTIRLSLGFEVFAYGSLRFPSLLPCWKFAWTHIHSFPELMLVSYLAGHIATT